MARTDEQFDAERWFQSVIAAVEPTARIKPDEEGWPLVPGYMGQVEYTGDRQLLAVFTNHQNVRKLLAIPGVRKHQMGAGEARMLFSATDADCLRAVLEVIRFRVRRRGGQGMSAEHMARIRPLRTPATA